MQAMPEQTVVASMEGYLTSWNRNANLLRVAHVVLGVLSTVCPAIAGAQAHESKVLWASIVGSAAAAILSLVDVRGLGNRTRRGWRILNRALLEFRSDPRPETTKRLVEQYYYAETVIGDVTPDEKAHATSA